MNEQEMKLKVDATPYNAPPWGEELESKFESDIVRVDAKDNTAPAPAYVAVFDLNVEEFTTTVEVSRPRAPPASKFLKFCWNRNGIQRTVVMLGYQVCWDNR